MEKINLRGLILGCAALIVLTQVACTAWLGRQDEASGPVNHTSELAKITEQLASVKTAVDDVQASSDNIQGRTEALVASMSSVSRTCAFR